MSTQADAVIVGYDLRTPTERQKQDQLWRRGFVETTASIASGCGRFLASTQAYAAAGTGRYAMFANSNCTDLVLHFSGFRQSAGTVVSDPTFTVKCSLQMADGAGAPTGVAIPVYFGGVRTATVNAATVVKSDPMPIPLVNGQKFFVVVYSTQAGYSNRTFTNAISSGDGWLATTDASDTLSGLATSNNAMNIAPFMVSGTVNLADDTAVAILADTNGEAYLWDTQQAGAISPGRQGWIERGVGRYCSTVNLAGAGLSASTVANPQLSAPLLYALSYCRDVIIQLGASDLSGTVVNLQTQLTTLATQLRAAGIRKVLVSTLTPITTATATASGDWWFSLANQSVGANEAKRVSINRWLRSAPSAFDGIIDPCQYVESSQDSGLWNPGFASNNTTFGTVNNASQFAVTGAGFEAEGQFVLWYTDARYVERFYSPTCYCKTAFGSVPTAGFACTLYQTFTADGTNMGSWGHVQAAQAITPDLLA